MTVEEAKAMVESGAFQTISNAPAVLLEEVGRLQAFKDWVHGYLDGKGVPHHPPGVHGAEGCRIGDRMDWVFAELDRLRLLLVRKNEALSMFGNEAMWTVSQECGILSWTWLGTPSECRDPSAFARREVDAEEADDREGGSAQQKESPIANAARQLNHELNRPGSALNHVAIGVNETSQLIVAYVVAKADASRVPSEWRGFPVEVRVTGVVVPLV